MAGDRVASPILRRRTRPSIFWTVAVFIVAGELAERCAFYGNRQGLNNFLKGEQYFDLGTSVAVALTSLVTQLYYAWGMFGAFLGDVKFGRFRVLLSAMVLYSASLTCMALASSPWFMAHPLLAKSLFFGALFLPFSVSGGAIKGNLSTFGADQFRPENDPAEAEDQKLFFSIFFSSINLGAILAYGPISEISAHGLPPLIPSRLSYFAGFSVSAACMVLALGVFLIPSSKYCEKPPDPRALSQFLEVMQDAVALRRNFGAWAFLLGILCLASAFVISLVPTCLRVTGHPDHALVAVLPFVAVLLLATGFVLLLLTTRRPLWITSATSWCRNWYPGRSHHADSSVDGPQQHEAYRIIRTIPTAIVLTTMWAAQGFGDGVNQMILQQTDMRLPRISAMRTDPCDDVQIPGPMMNMLDPLVIVFGVSLMERCVYPCLRGGRPSIMLRITLGLCCALLGVVWTAILEPLRRNAPLVMCDDGTPLLGMTGRQPLSTVPFPFMLVPYCLLALAQVFASPACYELFYCEVGPGLRSMCFALNMLCSSFGGMIESLIYTVWSTRITDDLNDGHAEFAHLTAAAILVLSLILHCTLVVPSFEDSGQTANRFTKVRHTLRGEQEDGTTREKLDGLESLLMGCQSTSTEMEAQQELVPLVRE